MTKKIKAEKNLKTSGFCPKTVKLSKQIPLIYKEEDFDIADGTDTDDSRIAYQFHSKDGKISANLFWKKGDVQIRGMVGSNGIIHSVYPLLNPVKYPIENFCKIPPAKVFLNSIINTLKRGEYYV